MNTEKIKQKFLRLPRWGIVTIIVIAIFGLLFIFRSLFIVALVNGRPIFRFSVINELEKQSGKMTLDNLVSQQLIFQEAKKRNIVVANSDIDAEVNRIEGLLKAQGTNLSDALAAQGLTLKDWRLQIEIQMVLQKILSDKIQVSDKEVADYFTTNKDLFAKNAQLADVKDQIVSQLTQQKLREAATSFITDLKAKAKINYFISY